MGLNRYAKGCKMAAVWVVIIMLCSGCVSSPRKAPTPTPATPTMDKALNWPLGIDFAKMKGKTYLRMDKAPWATDYQNYEKWDKAFYEKFGVKVRDVRRPSVGDTEKLQLMVACQDAPALISCGASQFPLWPLWGLVQPLNPWLNPKDTTFNKDILNAYSIDQNQYLMQSADNAPPMGIVYNRSLFHQQGMPLPRDLARQGAWTYEKFREVAKAWNIPTQQENVYNRYGYEINQWETWFAANQASFYSVNTSTGDATSSMAEPATVEVWNYLQQGVQSHDFKYGWDALADMSSGKAVMMVAGMNMAWTEGFMSNPRAKQNGFEFDWAPLPRSPSNMRSQNPQDVYVPYVWARAVGANAKNAEIGFAYYWYSLSQKQLSSSGQNPEEAQKRRLLSMNRFERDLHEWDAQIRGGLWPRRMVDFSACPGFDWSKIVWEVCVNGSSYDETLQKYQYMFNQALGNIKIAPRTLQPAKPILPQMIDFETGTIQGLVAMKGVQISIVDALPPLRGKALQMNNYGEVNRPVTALKFKDASYFFPALNVYRVTMKYRVTDGFEGMSERGLFVALCDTEGTQICTVSMPLGAQSGTISFSNLVYMNEEIQQGVYWVVGLYDPGTIYIDDIEISRMIPSFA